MVLGALVPICKGYKVTPQLDSLPLIVKFICHMYDTGISHANVASAIAVVSKYHIPNKDSGVNVGRYPLVTTTKIFFGT